MFKLHSSHSTSVIKFQNKYQLNRGTVQLSQIRNIYSESPAKIMKTVHIAQISSIADIHVQYEFQFNLLQPANNFRRVNIARNSKVHRFTCMSCNGGRRAIVNRIENGHSCNFYSTMTAVFRFIELPTPSIISNIVVRDTI